MKIVYMGTPDFAVEPLKRLIEMGEEIVCVVTQPDKVKGRGKDLSQSPVKECALKYGIPVIQPVKIREEQWVTLLREYNADLFVVAAFGQILSKEILEMPKWGCINIHASLLPKYRGAAPIQWCILNGETETGVTIQQMAEGVDTGDILLQSKINIEKTDTGESLFDKLMYVGADLVCEAVKKIADGTISAVKQDESEATHVGKITKELGKINWCDDAAKIERFVRGLNSWPSAYTYLNNKTFKIWKSEVVSGECDGSCGTVTEVSKDSFTVKTGKELLRVTEVQLEGKKRMSVHDFLLGYTLSKGEILG